MTTGYIQECTASLDVKAAMELLKADAATVGADQEANVVSDLGNLRTAVIAALAGLDTIATAHNTLATALNTLATKLNADAGVTDTNYSAANATNAATNYAATDTPAAIATE